MNADYAKAKARAEKKGRKLPPQDEYFATYGIYYGELLPRFDFPRLEVKPSQYKFDLTI